MREALLIARREYLERIRSKAFRISTVLIPVIFCVDFRHWRAFRQTERWREAYCGGLERSGVG